MSKKLAIKGHPTRGKEVIELLEMMGGKNTAYYGTDINVIYTIDDKGIIRSLFFNDSVLMKMEYNIFTLEEFLEKYPYKVGDKIPDVWGNSCTVKSMSWDENYKTVMYGFKETIFVARGDEMYLTNVVNNAGLKIEKNMNTNIEFDLTKYSYEIKEGKLVVSEKTPKYPTTYEECYDEGNTELHFIYVDKDERNLYESFIQLIRCRNAYWKIAGEEMGLDKPWEPDWNDLNRKYFISLTCDGIGLYDDFRNPQILAFPTEEMRDAFYENFKDLIESCKELL